jgi:hypothetical protein
VGGGEQASFGQRDASAAEKVHVGPLVLRHKQNRPAPAVEGQQPKKKDITVNMVGCGKYGWTEEEI